MSKAQALYIHVPFCEHICSYCDFARSGYHSELADRWLAQMKKDLSSLEVEQLQTIYIGGGTPTALSYKQLEDLLRSILKYTEGVVEYTIEVNPETLDEDKATLLAKYGINRVSLGVQSFEDSLLDIINRRHRLVDIQNALRYLHFVGIRNISIDLIYSLPSQSLEMWKSDLELAVLLPITHISLYSLTIEEHSAFGRMHVKAQDNELEAMMYQYAIDFLKSRGFDHYEVANFSKEGHDALHNKVYWHYDNFIALGCGASGKEDDYRYDIPFKINEYIDGHLEAIKIPLSKEDQMFEFLMMNLRLFEGCDKDTFSNRFHESIDTLFSDIIQEKVDSNVMWNTKQAFGFSESGMFLMHDILVEFMEALEKRVD